MRDILGKIKLLHLALLVVCVCIYQPGLDGPFVFDDVPGIVDNPAIANASTPWQAITVTGPSDTAAYGRPLVSLLWWAEYQLGDGEPAVFHWMSLLLHMTNAELVLMLLRSILPDPLKKLSELIALLWAFHPLLSESVLYASSQTELLASLMLLATLNAALRGRYLTAVICCILGMFCKEWMVIAPLLVWLALSLKTGLSYKSTFLRHLELLVCLCGCCLIVVLLMSLYPRTQSTGYLDGWNSWNYLLTQTQALHHYYMQTIKPTRLAIDLWFPRAQGLGDVWFYALPIVCLLAAWLMCLVSRHRIGFWLSLFFLILAPTSSIIPITTEIAAERRMYLPMLGLLVFLIFTLHFILQKYNRPQLTSWVLLIACLLIPDVTFKRAILYQSQVLLYEDTVAKFPENRRAARNLGSWYYEHRMYDKALQTYENVLKNWAGDVRVQLDRAIVLIKLNRLHEAIEIFETHRDFIAQDAITLSILGDCYRRLDQWDQAQQAYMQAIQVDKDNNYLHKTFLANTFAHQQKWLQAIHWQKQALENSALIPQNKLGETWNILGMYYGMTDQYQLATDAFAKAQSWPQVTPRQVLEDAKLNQLRALELLDLQKKSNTQSTPSI